jgi:hypothetical protein
MNTNTVAVSAETLSKEQELQNKKRDRLVRLTQVFSRANSVLTSRKINVHVVDDKSKNSPAWSGASDVYFNLNEVRDEFDSQSLLSLQGLNFHELAHVRYTPRNGSEICRWVIEEDKWQAFNALEDQRIEGLLVSRFPSIVNWLTATVLDYLVREPKALTTLFALVRGRRYLPVEVRALARENYANQNDITELCDVVDSYRTLLFPEDTEVAKDLITRYHNLLQNLPLIPQDGGNGSGEGEGATVEVRIYDPNGHADRPTQGLESSHSRPASKEEQKQDRDNLSNTDKQDEAEVVKPKPDVVINVVKEDTTPSNDDSDSSSDSDSDSSDDSDSDSTANGGADSDLDSDDFDDSDDDFDSDSSGKGWSDTPSDVEKEQQVTDSVITDLLDSITDELSKELDRLSIQVNGSPLLEGTNAKTPRKAQYENKPVTPDLHLVAKAFARELERLRAKHDPAWNKHVDSGRLNVNRYLNGDDFDSVFDEWQEGRDDVTAIEAVICLDYSGSMSGSNADNAYKSMWAIKKALEQVNARTTVVCFDHNTTLLYGADEKAGTTIRDAGANGSTNPEEALLYAQNILANTEQPIRLLFTITDGYWESAKGEEAVRQMKSAGVLTCQSLIGFGNRDLEAQRHSFELLAGVDSAKDVLSLGKDLVRLAIARQLVTR